MPFSSIGSISPRIRQTILDWGRRLEASSVPPWVTAPTPRSDPSRVYRRPKDRMPKPGELIAAFSPQPGRRFKMVQSRQNAAEGPT